MTLFFNMGNRENTVALCYDEEDSGRKEELRRKGQKSGCGQEMPVSQPGCVKQAVGCD